MTQRPGDGEQGHDLRHRAFYIATAAHELLTFKDSFDTKSVQLGNCVQIEYASLHKNENFSLFFHLTVFRNFAEFVMFQHLSRYF